MTHSPSRIPNSALRVRLRRVRLLVLDVDGVLTDGRLYYTSRGETFVAFHILDGHGIKLAGQCGLAVAIVTGRHSPMVARRARELGVRLLMQGVEEKGRALERLLRRCRLEASEAAAMGDDLLDLPMLTRVGLALAVPDAAAEVRAAAHYVTRRPGGLGAVREAIELILRAQGTWPGPEAVRG
jgi:3-deoxy-D-manno-octulosonate 8-phosphate phosphatase (KDO 8-P phosphatase)